MDNNLTDQALDKILEQALRSGIQAPVPVGLETRIANHVQRADRKRKAVVLGAMATAAASLWLLFHPANQAIQPLVQQSRLTVPVQLYVAPIAIPGPVRAGAGVRKARLPKLNVFPAPSPLTREEQALVSMARRYPAEMALAFEHVREADQAPVHIEPLRIEPLSETLPPGEKQ